MDKFNDLFLVKDDPTKVKEGSILISEPLGRDVFFKKSVVLIAEHNNKGTIGYVLNRTLNFFTKDTPDIFSLLSKHSAKISLGGPVELNTLHFIHTLGNKLGNTVQLQHNLFWGGDFELLIEFLKAGTVSPNQVKFFAGYSGWSAGQLYKELINSQWVVSCLPTEEIINTPHKIWDMCVKSLGERFKPWLHIPEDPEMN